MISIRRRTPKKPETFREHLDFYLVDTETTLGKAIDIAIILLNLAIIVILVIETYDISPELREMLWITELVIVGFFIVEYIARLYGAEDRWKQIFDLYSIIDLIAILPTLILIFYPNPSVGLIRLVRSFRAFRIFRFLRFAQFAASLFGPRRGTACKFCALQ